jgi:hypothetical protein
VLVLGLLFIGAALGFFINRWWVVASAVPIGVWLALDFDAFENSSPPYWDFGAIVALILAGAIVGGILLRRALAQRRAS